MEKHGVNECHICGKPVGLESTCGICSDSDKTASEDTNEQQRRRQHDTVTELEKKHK